MKLFYTIIALVIIFILSFNSFLLLTFGESFLEGNTVNKQFFTLILLNLLETGIIIILMNKFFNEPIKKLEYTIKSFLVGGLKDTKVEFKDTPNPHINYIFSFFSRTLNTLKSIKSEFIHGKEIKGEVELAKEIQGKIFAKKQTEIPSLNVISKSKPAGEIGGDSFDIIRQEDNYYIYVGDATGHGVGAGFIMMMVNALISGYSKIFLTGDKVLSNTNLIIKPRVKANLLMSLLLLRWNEKEKKMFMTGAGHEYLMIYKNEQKKCIRIKSGGVALGMIKDISKVLKETEVEFEKNDIIVLYSDGITESINKSSKDGTEEMFGEDRLMDAIEDAPDILGKDHKSASNVFNNITIKLSKFMGYKYTQLDDITLSVIHYRGENYDIANDEIKELPEDFITEWKW